MGVAKKNAKATKKFEKKHLKGVLEKRKATAKIKQRAQAKTQKQAKVARDAEFYSKKKGSGEGEANGDAKSAAPRGRSRPDAKVSSMSMDEFFQGGFQILDEKKKGSGGGLGKRKRQGAGAGAAQGDDDSEDDAEEGSSDDADDALETSAAFGEDSDADEDDVDDEDIGMSKAAMEALAEKDPEFYKFLKENDPEALNFDENADMGGIDELSPGEEDDDDDEEEEGKRPKKKQKKSKPPVEDDHELTRALVSKWKASMEATYSLRAAREVVIAFRSAAHLNEESSEDDPRRGGGPQTRRYTIKSPEVFHDVLVVALEHVPLVLQHHVPVKESAGHRVYVAGGSTGANKLKTLSGLVRSFTAAVLHLLGTLSDDATLKRTLSALTPLLPYLLSFRKLLKHLVRTVVAFWAQPASSETTRLTAFLVLRRLAVIGDRGVREAVLKAAYQGLVQGSRVTNANTLAGIHLMKTSAAALWGIDPAIGYTTAFAAIRQLALHLRNSIVHNQNSAFRAVYNWQYVHSLDFWATVLAEHCNPQREAEAAAAPAEGASSAASQLRLLVYPLVQVTLGAMRLIPTATYFPLRFQLFRSLLRVSRATGTYIPLAPALLEVLQSAEMKKKPSGSGGHKGGSAGHADLKELDFSVAYKASKAYLRTAVYQTAVGEQVVELMAEYFALWSTSIAFPEFALPVVIMLKRWLKEARKPQRGGGGRNSKSSLHSQNNKVVAGLVLLVQKLEANAKFIEEKRARIDFAPRDRTQVDAFLKDFDWQKTPIGAFVVTQRRLLADKQRSLAEARKEDAQRRLEEKQAKTDAVEEEEGSEDEEEDEAEEEEVDDDDADEEEAEEQDGEDWQDSEDEDEA